MLSQPASVGTRPWSVPGPAGLWGGLGIFLATLPGRVDEDVWGHPQPVGQLPVDLAGEVLRLVAGDGAAEVHLRRDEEAVGAQSHGEQLDERVNPGHALDHLADGLLFIWVRSPADEQVTAVEAELDRDHDEQ